MAFVQPWVIGTRDIPIKAERKIRALGVDSVVYTSIQRGIVELSVGCEDSGVDYLDSDESCRLAIAECLIAR